MTSPIEYLTGDATQPQREGSRVIVHVCNDIGGWGKGFVMALSKRWPTPEASYREWYKNRANNDFALGAVQFVDVEPTLWVANLIGQQGLRPVQGRPPIRYDAIRQGLRRVATFASEHSASIHMPRIGCGLAGGKWDAIEPLIVEELCTRRVSVTVYDFV